MLTVYTPVTDSNGWQSVYGETPCLWIRRGEDLKKVTNYTEKEPSSTDKLQTAIDLVEMDSVTRRPDSLCHQC